MDLGQSIDRLKCLTERSCRLCHVQFTHQLSSREWSNEKKCPTVFNQMPNDPDPL